MWPQNLGWHGYGKLDFAAFLMSLGAMFIINL